MESLINEKLSRMREYLGYLEALRDAPLETFMTDFKARGAAERYLHLAIEAVIDIGNEIISALQLRRPERYGEIPHVLAEAGIIPRDFADDVAKMIGFRNLLVHDYASIDRVMEHGFLRTRIPDFKKYMNYIANWLMTGPFDG